MASIHESHRPTYATFSPDGQHADPLHASLIKENTTFPLYEAHPGGSENAERTRERRLKDLIGTVDTLARIDQGPHGPIVEGFTDRLIQVMEEQDDSKRPSMGPLTEHAAQVLSQMENPSNGIKKAKERIDMAERADVLRAKRKGNPREYIEQRPSAVVMLGVITKYRRVSEGQFREDMEKEGISGGHMDQLQEMFSGLRELGLILEYGPTDESEETSFMTTSTGLGILHKMSPYKPDADLQTLVGDIMTIMEQNADKKRSQPPIE